MFLSVSIPVYNAEMYLDRCVQSIVSQSFTDYELILVNDGSKDNSLLKCLKWQEMYPSFIRVVNKDNSGSLLTRRRCLQESKGDFCYIMDADDYLLSDKVFQIIKSHIEDNGCDLVFFEATNNVDRIRYFQYPFNDEKIFKGDSLNEIYNFMIKTDKLNSLWNKVFSRELIDWDFDYNRFAYVGNGTDMFQSVPIILGAKKIQFINQVFYFYQTNNENSIVHRFNSSVYISLKASYQRLVDEIKKHDLMSDYVHKELSVRYMNLATTSAYKARLIKFEEKEKCINYLRSIAEDPFFLETCERVSLSEISMFRRIIAWSLIKGHYELLRFVFFLSRKILKK